MRNLGETAGLMVAVDYRYRMAAELAQLYIRERGIERRIYASPESRSRYLLEDQLNGMVHYMRVLETRVNIEWGGEISNAILRWAVSDSSEPLIYAIDRWYGARANKED